MPTSRFVVASSDGAYGGSAIFSDQHRNLLRGIEQADSLITIDPSQVAAMPLAAGVILTRHPAMLERAFAVAAPYMPKAAESKGITIRASAMQWTRSHELAKTLAHTAGPRQKSLRGTHRSSAQTGTEFCVLGDVLRTFRVGCSPNSAHCGFRFKMPCLSAQQLEEVHNSIVDEVTRDGHPLDFRNQSERTQRPPNDGNQLSHPKTAISAN